MNCLFNSICLVLIVFNLLKQSAHKRYITTISILTMQMEIKAMSRRQLRRHRRPSSLLSSLHHHASEVMNRKWKSKRSASHRHSINSGRLYMDAEVQERIDRNNFRRGRLSTSGYLTLRNCSHRSSSSDSNFAFPKNLDGMTTIRFYYSNY